MSAEPIATESALPHAPEPPWPSQPYAWYVVAVLLFAYTLSFIDRMILSLLIAPIRAALDISDTEISLLVGLAFGLFYTLMGLPLGWLADTKNRKVLITGGIGLWSIMTASCGLAGSYLTLFLARMGVGVGEASLSPAAYSMLSDYFPRDKLARAIAVYSVGIPLGSGIALVLGAFIIKAVLASPPVTLPLVGTLDAWRLIFLWVALPGVLAVLLMMTVKEPFRRGQSKAPAGLPGRDLLKFLRAHWKAVTAHIGGMSLISITMYGIMAWTPSFLARSYGMPIATAGLWFGAITGLCGAGGVLAGGWLADKMFQKGRVDAHLRTMLIAIVLGGPLLVAAPLMPTAGLAIAMLAAAMLVITMHGIAAGALQLIAPNGLRAQLSAVYGFVVSLIGLGLGPTSMALVTDFVFHDDKALRYSMAIVAGVALTLAALVLAWGLKPFGHSVQAAENGWATPQTA